MHVEQWYSLQALSHAAGVLAWETEILMPIYIAMACQKIQYG